MVPPLSPSSSSSSSSTLHLPPPFRSRALSTDKAHLHKLLSPYLPISSKHRIAVWRLPSHIALVLAHLAPHLPNTLVWLNDRWNSREAIHALRITNAALLILPDNHRILLHENQLKHVRRVSLHRNPLTGDLALSALSAPPPSHPGHLDTQNETSRLPSYTIFFTSGTTSYPKPVLLSHSSLHVQSLAKIATLSLSASTIYLHLAPLFHLSGHSSSHAVSLVNGTHVFPPSHLGPSNPQHAEQLLHYAKKARVNILVIVPSVLQLLLDAAHGQVLQDVRTLLYGGGRLSPPLRKAVATTFPNSTIVGAYGMTEAASSITFLCHDQLPDESPLHSSAGWSPPHVDLHVDPISDTLATQRQDSDDPVVGEVLTRGPHLMTGYDHLDTGIDHKGWFRTGDLGYLDKATGALFLVGRLKDMIKSGGENVFAGEVEDTLVSCGNVREAAVVGIPHRVLGEAVAAAVVLVNDVRRTQSEVLKQLAEACRQCLSPFKRPKWIVLRDGLPKNATGKILKDKVRRQLERQVLIPRAKL